MSKVKVTVEVDDLETAIHALRHVAQRLLNSSPIDEKNEWVIETGNERMDQANRLSDALAAGVELERVR